MVPINKLTVGTLVITHPDFFGMVEEYGENGTDILNLPEKSFYLIPRPYDENEI